MRDDGRSRVTDAVSASAPASDQPDLASLLGGLRRDQVLRDLEVVLDRFDDLEARLVEQEADEDVEPGIVEALEAVTGAEGAPVSFRSLHDRVRRNLLTWKDFWADPTAQTDGMAIMFAATRLRLAHAAEVAQEQPPEE